MNLYASPARASTVSHGNAAEPIPADLDPGTHPIIARHWFGVGPLRHVGPIAAEVVADLRFRRQVIRLHQQGDRVLGELLAHLGAKHGIQTSIEQTVDRFAELEPETLQAAGGDEFWPAPLREVRP